MFGTIFQVVLYVNWFFQGGELFQDCRQLRQLFEFHGTRDRDLQDRGWLLVGAIFDITKLNEAMGRLRQRESTVPHQVRCTEQTQLAGKQAAALTDHLLALSRR